jgi:uncharacterized membrane protein YvbJ
LIVSFCKKCGFNNWISDKYCGGCGVKLTAQADTASEDTREEPATGRYSAAELDELTASRSEGKSSTIKKKSKADEEQMSQDTVSEMFNSRKKE